MNNLQVQTPLTCGSEASRNFAIPSEPIVTPQKFPHKLKPHTKRAEVLQIFLELGDLGLNCFESVRLAHDYVLRSTISDLSQHYGLVFRREWEKIPGHAGSSVDCVRYVLDPASRQRAAELLGMASHDATRTA